MQKQQPGDALKKFIKKARNQLKTLGMMTNVLKLSDQPVDRSTAGKLQYLTELSNVSKSAHETILVQQIELDYNIVKFFSGGDRTFKGPMFSYLQNQEPDK
jgi:hypothetical protein